jgi:hypothetical protein
MVVLVAVAVAIAFDIAVAVFVAAVAFAFAAAVFICMFLLLLACVTSCVVVLVSVHCVPQVCGNATVYCPEGSAAPVPVPVGYYSTPVSGNPATRTDSSLCSKGATCSGGVQVRPPYPACPAIAVPDSQYPAALF